MPNLCNADLSKANLNNAILFAAELNNADLYGANLNNAKLRLANLNNAHLDYAKLNHADLVGANLYGANLYGANLYGANLYGAEVAGARLVNADVTGVIYAPVSPPLDPYVAGIKGLRTVTFPPGNEVGLVQLRDLFQKAGLRDLEREATYTIECGRTRYALDEWKVDPVHAGEGVFRFIFFDATTAYGLHPARALIIIVALWAALIPVYFWPILPQKRIKAWSGSSGIYRIWPKDRIEFFYDELIVESPIKAERLQGAGWTALGWASYFSLLSAFHIGFREFNVGI